MAVAEVGKEYDVKHKRKGNFRIRVENVNGSLVSGKITKGQAFYLSEGKRKPGDKIDLDTSLGFIQLTLVKI